MSSCSVSRVVQHLSIISLAFVVTACLSTDAPKIGPVTDEEAWFSPTQEQVDAANRVCSDQVGFDQRSGERTWFTRWLKCKQARIMPLEVRLYPGKGKEIRAMYTELLRLGEAVDAGESRVEPVYDAWDRMQAEIGMYKGVCIKNSDGSQECRTPGESSMFMQTNEGRLTPLN